MSLAAPTVALLNDLVAAPDSYFMVDQVGRKPREAGT